MDKLDRVTKLADRLEETGDECILIARDNETDRTVIATLAFSPDSIFEMFADFFRDNFSLIPEVLKAAAFAIQMPDCEGECDDCDHTDDCPFFGDETDDDICVN